MGKLPVLFVEVFWKKIDMQGGELGLGWERTVLKRDSTTNIEWSEKQREGGCSLVHYSPFFLKIKTYFILCV